jgi:hypothetical protein
MNPIFYLKLFQSAESPRTSFHSASKPFARNPSLPAIHVRPYPIRKKTRLLKPLSLPAQGFFLYAGAVVPLVCIATAVFHSADAAWQSGQLRDYTYSLFQGTAWLVFAPLILYSTVCFCLLVCDESRMVHYPAVRFGVYTGAILAIHFVPLYLSSYADFHFEDLFEFLWVSGFSALFVLMIASLLALPFFVFSSFRGVLYGRLPRKSSRAEELLAEIRRPHRTGVVAVLFFLAVVAMTTVVAGRDMDGGDIRFYLLLPWGLTCLIGPFCSLAGYGMMVRRIWGFQTHPFRFSLAWLFLVVVWFAFFMAAWHYAAGRMLEFYHQLPNIPPKLF